MTVMPELANALVIFAPIPALAPVTKATFPFHLSISYGCCAIPITILWLLFLLLWLCDEATQLVSVLKTYSLYYMYQKDGQPATTLSPPPAVVTLDLLWFVFRFLLILPLSLLLIWMFLDLLSAKCSAKTVSALLTIIAFIQIFHIIKVVLCVKLLPVYFECFGWLYSMNTLISFRGISVAIKCVELLLLCFTNYFRRILIHVHS